MPPKSKQANTNTAIVVALIGLIGTLITALFTSPVLIELIKRSGSTPTLSPTFVPSPDATLVFSEDFEDGVASGFAFETGDWKIGKDRSNSVLELTAKEQEFPGARAYVGPSKFSDGIIEFRLKFIEWYGFFFDFRLQGENMYVLEIEPADSRVLLMFNQSNALSSFGENTHRPFTFQKGVWYTVRVEMRGAQAIVSIDGTQIITGSNEQLLTGSLRFTLAVNGATYIDDIKIWSYAQ